MHKWQKCEEPCAKGWNDYLRQTTNWIHVNGSFLSLTLMMQVANLANKTCKNWKMNETLVYGYSYETTKRELSNEYQYDRV